MKIALPGQNAARWALYAAIGLAVAAALAFALWWLFFRPAEAVRREGVAKVDAIAGNTTAALAEKAIDLTVTTERQRLDVRVITEKGQANVRNAPDADVAAPGVAAAMRASVCLLHDKERAAGAARSLRADAACEQDPRADASDADQPD